MEMPLITRLHKSVVVAALLLAAGVFLGGGRQAFAHADLESSNPEAGAVLTESPPEIEMIFGQQLARQGELPSVIVVNEAGDILADEPVVDDNDRTRLTIQLPPALGDGEYTVIWHSLSDDDGEEAQGAWHFYIGEGPTPRPSGDATPPGDVTPTPAGTVVTAPPAGSASDGGDDVPLWALIGGLAVALVVGTSAGVTLATRRGA
jgi:methionine-rich copper-binding protein CopC